MPSMNTVYARDLDLNLLRVFIAVADAGSVTGAAERLYVTQPAISAALRRLRLPSERRSSPAMGAAWR
jgi:LysR family transcriptional activator of mexEF-oprN operon